MQIKRYEAKNMTMALRMVKEELGPEAVILSARSLRTGRGIFSSAKHNGVEVTAAVDSNHFQAGFQSTSPAATKRTRTPVNAAQRYRENSVVRAGMLEGNYTKSKEYTGSYDRGRSDRRPAGLGQGSGLIDALYQQLLDQDIERSIAAALIDEIQRIPGIEGIYGLEQIRNHLKDLLEDMNIRFHPLGLQPEMPKLIALVGPPGVGKTTTLAKLATRQASAGRTRVALIGMDGYRIGAVRELETYADIIEVPLAVLNTPAALRATLKRFKKYDVVYLDTPGIGVRDQQRFNELQAALAKVKKKEIHLLLSANTRDRDLAATVERFKSLPVSCIGFTRLDECSTYGVLINILSRTRIPLSVLSAGQRIPEDLENGSLDVILDWVLGDFNEFAANTSGKFSQSTGRLQNTPDGGARYVANRNSDVYHTRNCKWTRKIKPENMVEFATLDEAESQRYLPCRTCKPDAESLDDIASFAGDRVTLTSYR